MVCKENELKQTNNKNQFTCHLATNELINKACLPLGNLSKAKFF